MSVKYRATAIHLDQHSKSGQQWQQQQNGEQANEEVNDPFYAPARWLIFLNVEISTHGLVTTSTLYQV
jgi:hypothetical protein